MRQGKGLLESEERAHTAAWKCERFERSMTGKTFLFLQIEIEKVDRGEIMNNGLVCSFRRKIDCKIHEGKDHE